LALGVGLRAEAAEPLTVCLQAGTPPFSYLEAKQAKGFDVAVAGKVAEALGRPLKIQWLEVSKRPENDEPDPARAENAMLNYGKCQLVGGFPLIANDIAPTDEKSRLPEYRGQSQDERKMWVKIGRLIASEPYHFFPFTVLLGPKAEGRKIASLRDIQGLHIGSEDGTLADAMLMWFGHRMYMRQIVHFMPANTLEHGGGLLDHLDRGDIDATMVELRRYDVYRAKHPDTKITATGFYHRIGFNMGFVALPKDEALIDRVNGAIDALTAKKELPALAKAEGMTYVAPREPAVRAGVVMGDLMAGDNNE
jgi:ABC-type amino acid transport substrate-binding protein